jgi:hypothetical protein
VPSGARNPIDSFIQTRLAKEGLNPSPEADRRTLLRRVTLDLTGLAPEPAQIEAFVKDKSPDAYQKVVDRLLASQAYAEQPGDRRSAGMAQSQLIIFYLRSERFSPTLGS